MRTTRDLVVVSLAAGLSVALGQLKLWRMPQGGSVTLEALPILYLALRFGPKPGMAAGAISGIVQLLVDPYIVHPIQIVIDYPLAMSVIGLAGFVRVRDAMGLLRVWSIVAGVLVGVLAKYACHLVSGAIFFGSFAAKGQSVWAYSAIYNLYAIVSGVFAVILLPPIFRRLVAE